jgi:hypothetical protein
VRRKTLETGGLPPLSSFVGEESSFPLGNVGTSPWVQADRTQPPGTASAHMPRSESSRSDEMPFSNLQNPSDALGILARAAETSSEENGPSGSEHARAAPPAAPLAQTPTPQASTFSYALVDNGRLAVHTLCQLLARYREHYHPYYPLAPAETFDTTRLALTAKNEPHLLTAILVISSKDLVDESHIYEACSEHMQSLVSKLAAGGQAEVEAVEALLILAEWAPYTQRGSAKVGKGEEDKESWMHVGIALRIAYFLALDKYSFRFVDHGKDPKHSRKRLLWTAAYVSDRHISIRIGKAFWSRGPGPLTTLRREDYPSLIPRSPSEEDYASIFQGL